MVSKFSLLSLKKLSGLAARLLFLSCFALLPTCSFNQDMSKPNVTKLNVTQQPPNLKGGLWGALDTDPPIDNTFSNMSPADIHLNKTQTIPNPSSRSCSTITIPRGDQNTVHQSIGLIRYRNRSNQEVLVTDWLITNLVT